MAIVIDPPAKPRARSLSLRRIAILAFSSICLVTVFLAFGLYKPLQLRFSTNRYDFPGAELILKGHSSSSSLPQTKHTTTVVVGRLDDDPFQVDWIVHMLRGITSNAVYIVDDPGAPLHLDHNHGRESMVYLRYILDNYDDLNEITFFFHAHQKAWHNNLLHRQDSAVAINMMNRAYVLEKGYVNSRCDAYPGCPKWIKFNPSWTEMQAHDTRFADLYNTDLWAKLFPNASALPTYLSQPCCSQFAVSRAMIRSVPRATYQRLADYIANDPNDGFSGRVMEYTWQYLFLGQEEVCPDVRECYCRLYGMCVDDGAGRMMAEWQAKITEADNADLDMKALKEELKGLGMKVKGDEHVERFRRKKDKADKRRQELEEELLTRYAVGELLGPGLFG